MRCWRRWRRPTGAASGCGSCSTPGRTSTLPALKLLLDAGVEVRWYPAPPGAKLHAKTALFDGQRLLLGSANWSLSGLSVNHELDVESTDPGAVRAYEARFDADWPKSA